MPQPHACFECDRGTCLEQFPVACQDLDREGVIRRINRAFSSLLGYDYESLVGMPVWCLITPDQVERAQKGYARKLAGERHLLPFERAYLHADGRVLTVEVHDMLIRTSGGAVAGIRSALVDITTRTERAAELRTANAFADAVVGALPDGLIVTDILGLVTSMNAKAETLADMQESDCIGRPIEQVLALSRGVQSATGATLSAATLVRDLLATRGGVLRCDSGGATGVTQVEFSPMTDNSRAIVGFLAILR